MTWDAVTDVPGAYVWKNFLGRVSLPIGAPLRNLGKWDPSTWNFEK